MVRIIYIEFDGTQHVVDVSTGLSIMEGAIKNSVPGIDADCGGSGACATCHVYVDSTWIARTGPRTPLEDDMLDFAEKVGPGSRLACQIKVAEALDGLIVRLPESQR